MGVNDKIFLNWFTCVLLIFVYVISRINNLILPRPCKMNVVKFHKSTLRNCHLGEFSRRSRFYKDCRAQEKLIMVLHFMKLKQKTLGQIHTRIIASLTLLQMLGPQHCKSKYQYEERIKRWFGFSSRIVCADTHAYSRRIFMNRGFSLLCDRVTEPSMSWSCSRSTGSYKYISVCKNDWLNKMARTRSNIQ